MKPLPKVTWAIRADLGFEPPCPLPGLVPATADSPGDRMRSQLQGQGPKWLSGTMQRGVSYSEGSPTALPGTHQWTPEPKQTCRSTLALHPIPLSCYFSISFSPSALPSPSLLGKRRSGGLRPSPFISIMWAKQGPGTQ